MDPLSDVIALVQPESHRVGGFRIGGRWSIRFDALDGVKCYAVTAGCCWLAVEGVDEAAFLETGDCFLLPHGLPFRLCSDLTLPPADWRRYFLGARNGELVLIDDGDVTLVGAHFRLGGPSAALLLDALRPIVHLRSETDRRTLRWVFERMREELADPKPGSFAMARQLASTVLVQVLRLHMQEARGTGWLFALCDRHVGAAITAIHRQPARRWTVQGLAAEVGMSRSSFAARFRRLMGEGPIEYLTRWRMLIAHQGLARGELIGSIAESIGYGSESAFSSAFKRVMGRPPRRRGRDGTLQRGGLEVH